MSSTESAASPAPAHEKIPAEIVSICEVVQTALSSPPISIKGDLNLGFGWRIAWES